MGRALQLDSREGALIIVTRERLQLRHVAAVVPRAVRILLREGNVVATRTRPAFVKTSLRRETQRGFIVGKVIVEGCRGGGA